MQTIECACHRTASGLLAHQGFDTQHFLHNPLGFGLADAHLVLQRRFADAGGERSATKSEYSLMIFNLGEKKIHDQDERDQAKQ